MPRWPLFLLPPAVLTSPSRSCRSSSSSHHRAIPLSQVVIVQSITVVPHRPSPSIHHRTIHHRQSPMCSQSIAVALAPSLVVEEPSRALPRRQGAVVPSIAVTEPLRTLPCRQGARVFHCPRGAVVPYLTIKESSALSTDESSHSSRPSQALVRLVVTLPLLRPPLPICRRLSLRHCLSCLSSVRLVVPSPCFSHRHLPSAGASVCDN